MEFNSRVQTNTGSSKIILESLTGKDLFIFSQSSLELIPDYKIGNANCVDRNDLSINLEAIDQFVEKNNFSRVVSLGNGQTSDIAKYISYKKAVHHICIPAIFSTNASFTNKSCLKILGKKETVQSKPPEVVLIDYDLIKRANFQYHYYGLCEVISIYTALVDWHLSEKFNNEKIDPFCYHLAETLTKTLEGHIDDLEKKNIDSLNIILKLVMMSGYVTNIYGSGRPESGSEHMFAKTLESQIDIFHAISVSIGALLMAKLQGKNYQTVLALIKRLGLLKEANKKGVTKDLVISSLLETMLRKDRFTILNIKMIDRKLATSLVNQVFKDSDLG
jgi:glycerol dehydrogenase-like iron-containing ADH family enzyme